MDEIKQQLALYQRLYYNKRKEDEQFMQKKREASLRHNQKRIKEYIEENSLSEEGLTPTQITEIISDKKPRGKKRGAPKYDMNEYKVILPNSLK